MKRFLPILVILLLVGAGAYFFLFRAQTESNVSLAPTPSPQVQNPILSDLKMWLPKANWTVNGDKATGVMTSDQAFVPPFEDQKTLSSLGFEPDLSLAAGGPGSSQWGYKNTKTGEIITFGYKTLPTSNNPNEPLQFKCPCTIDLTVALKAE